MLHHILASNMPKAHVLTVKAFPVTFTQWIRNQINHLLRWWIALIFRLGQVAGGIGNFPPVTAFLAGSHVHAPR